MVMSRGSDGFAIATLGKNRLPHENDHLLTM
jgi:hypothetical protein